MQLFIVCRYRPGTVGNKLTAGRKAKQSASIHNAKAADLGARSHSGNGRHDKIERSSGRRYRGISSVRNGGVKRVKR